MKKSAFIIAAALLILAAPAFAKAKASKKSKASTKSAKTSSVKFFKDPKTQKPYDFGSRFETSSRCLTTILSMLPNRSQSR